MSQDLGSLGLDRHITGNYGEDQFRGVKFCRECGREFWDESYHGDEEYCEDCMEQEEGLDG